jgi:hypothetical protein
VALVEALQGQVVRLHEQAMELQEQAFALARRVVGRRGIDDPSVADSETQLLLKVASIEIPPR